MLKKTIFVFAAVLILAAELKACPECCNGYSGCNSFVGSSLVNCVKPFIPKLDLKNLLLSRLLRSVVRCRKNPLLLGGLRYPYGGCQSSCLPYGSGIEYERQSALLAGPAALTPALTPALTSSLTSTVASPYGSYLGSGAYSAGGLCNSGLGSDCCCGNALCGGGCGGTCGGVCSGCDGTCGGCGGTCAGCGGVCSGCDGTCGGCGGTCSGCGGTCSGCGGPCGGCDGACLGPCGGCRNNCDDLCCGKRGSLFSGKMRTKCFEGGFSVGGC